MCRAACACFVLCWVVWEGYLDHIVGFCMLHQSNALGTPSYRNPQAIASEPCPHAPITSTSSSPSIGAVLVLLLRLLHRLLLLLRLLHRLLLLLRFPWSMVFLPTKRLLGFQRWYTTTSGDHSCMSYVQDGVPFGSQTHGTPLKQTWQNSFFAGIVGLESAHSGR